MTRVLALVTFKVFPPQMGGQKGVVYFYKHLGSLLPVTLALSRNNQTPAADWDAVPLLYDNRKMFLNPFAPFRLKKIIREKRIDVVVAEHSYAGWLGWLLKKMFQVPFVIHSHNIEALRFQQMGRRWWRLYGNYEKWIHQKADYNFFISREDLHYAQQQFGLPPHKCSVITYGVEPALNSLISKEAYLQSLGLNGSECIFYFNGTLDYKPNLDAVRVLIHQVAPLLQQQNISFKIIVSGNRAPQELVAQLQENPHFLYLHYVEDVQVLYCIADIFLNPVLNNTGVKTKVIEAIAAGCTVVSTQSGTWGIDRQVCGDKLRTVEDGNWQQFVKVAIEAAQAPRADTPKAFYDTYLWNNIARQAAQKIKEVARKHAN